MYKMVLGPNMCLLSTEVCRVQADSLKKWKCFHKWFLFGPWKQTWAPNSLQATRYNSWDVHEWEISFQTYSTCQLWLLPQNPKHKISTKMDLTRLITDLYLDEIIWFLEQSLGNGRKKAGFNSPVEGKVVEIQLFTRFYTDFWTINSIIPTIIHNQN